MYCLKLELRVPLCKYEGSLCVCMKSAWGKMKPPDEGPGHFLKQLNLFFVSRLSSLGGPQCITTIGRMYFVCTT